MIDNLFIMNIGYQNSQAFIGRLLEVKDYGVPDTITNPTATPLFPVW